MIRMQEINETFDTIKRAYEFNENERQIFHTLLAGINALADGEAEEFEMPIHKSSKFGLIRLCIRVERIKFTKDACAQETK